MMIAVGSIFASCWNTSLTFRLRLRATL